jgi:hypothetical protein
VCARGNDSVEIVAVRVSGTATNDDQRAYIKIETLRGKTPPLPPPPPPPLPPLPPHRKCFGGGGVGVAVAMGVVVVVGVAVMELCAFLLRWPTYIRDEKSGRKKVVYKIKTNCTLSVCTKKRGKEILQR